MEATIQTLTITEEQIQAIIADTADKLQAVIDEPIRDESDLDYYEDEYGHCYNSGSKSLEGELEEICYEGLPGIDNDSADIYICASYEGECDWHDDYDPGDYWTAPGGGIEVDSVEAYITDIDIEISVYDEATEEYVGVEVSEEIKQRIIDEVNKKVA